MVLTVACLMFMVSRSSKGGERGEQATNYAPKPAESWCASCRGSCVPSPRIAKVRAFLRYAPNCSSVCLATTWIHILISCKRLPIRERSTVLHSADRLEI